MRELMDFMMPDPRFQLSVLSNEKALEELTIQRIGYCSHIPLVPISGLLNGVTKIFPTRKRPC